MGHSLKKLKNGKWRCRWSGDKSTYSEADTPDEALQSSVFWEEAVDEFGKHLDGICDPEICRCCNGSIGISFARGFRKSLREKAG